MSEITMRIRGHSMPGIWCSGARTDSIPDPYGPVHVGIQHRRDVINLVSGAASRRMGYRAGATAPASPLRSSKGDEVRDDKLSITADAEEAPGAPGP